MSSSPRRLDVVGWSAMAITVVLWVTFALSTRAISFSHLTIMDVAAIRFTVPVIVLAPFLPRAFRAVRQAPLPACLFIAVGAGLPFYLFTAIGSDLSSATFVGVINPGLPPLYVAIFGFILFHQRYRPATLLGYAAILVGLVAMIAASGKSAHLSGAWVLMLAALCWAIYTMGLQRAKLDPISATLLVCLPTAVVAVGILATGAVESHLGSAPISEIVGFALIQGVGTGVISSIAYTIGVRRLGAITSATVGAISPAVTAVIAIPVFGEHLSVIAAIGVALVVGGIMTANLAIGRANQSAPATI